ncbi:hypothetical protein D3C87_1635510 [compost metagenome]
MIRTIEILVQQATNLAPFTLDGKRNLNYHYFQLTDNGWIFHWINEETDITWLTAKIGEGVIYVFKD